MNGKRRLLGSFNHGSMANDLPQAIGAQISQPSRQVVSMAGAGGFAMLMGDLLTLKQHQLPVKVIVFKSDALAFVELEMKARSILDFPIDLHNPDFTKIAEGAGLLGLRAETPEQVEPMMAEAFASAFLQGWSDGRIDAPTITLEEAKGFTLFMMKAVLSGRGDEIIDLARVNLLC